MTLLDRHGRPLVSDPQPTMESSSGGWFGGHRHRPGTAEWNPMVGSADGDNQPDRIDIIARSRHLGMNDPVSAGHLMTLATNVIGPSGLSPRPTFAPEDLGLTRRDARLLRKTVQRHWRWWSESGDACDYDGVSPLREMQVISLLGRCMSGDIFVARRRYAQNPLVKLQLQLIEGDRVLNPPGHRDGAVRAGSKNTITAGVEMDPQGRPVAFHIADQHPGDRPQSSDVRRVEIYNRSGFRRIIHLFDRKRPGQTRGMPIFASIIEPLKVLSRWSEARLLKAAVAACFTAFIKTSGAGTGLARGGALDAYGAASDATGERRLAPGSMVTLKNGEGVDFAAPNDAGGDYSMFRDAFLQAIGAALGTNFQTVSKTYLASFSGARAAMLDAWNFFRCERRTQDLKMLRIIYGWFIEDLVFEGLIDLPGFFLDPTYRASACQVVFDGEAPGHIDEVKAAQASGLRIENGTSTETIEAALQGHDREDLVEQRIQEREYDEEMGLRPETPDVPPTPPEQQKPEEDRDIDQDVDGEDAEEMVHQPWAQVGA